MENEIVIVRALWGNFKRALDEVFPFPIFKNEIVYVWGIDNQLFLEKRGFITVLMGEEISDPNYSTKETQYFHKLLVLNEAEEKHNEFIFLDWDCYILKPLDDYFYKTLREGNDVQICTYAFTDTKYAGLPKIMMFSCNGMYKNTIPEDVRDYIIGLETQLRKYSWKHDDLLVTPNFCFFYSRRPNVGKELLQIAKDNKIENCVEEHAMFLWANCSLDDFIKKYEPKVLQGSADETRLLMHTYDYENDPVIKINKYISERIEKTIYFKHI